MCRRTSTSKDIIDISLIYKYINKIKNKKPFSLPCFKVASFMKIIPQPKNFLQCQRNSINLHNHVPLLLSYILTLPFQLISLPFPYQFHFVKIISGKKFLLCRRNSTSPRTKTRAPQPPSSVVRPSLCLMMFGLFQLLVYALAAPLFVLYVVSFSSCWSVTFIFI